MSAKRFYFALIGANIFMVLLIGASLYIANRFLETQKDDLVQAKVENSAAQQQQNYLTQAKEDLEEYSELGQIVKSIVPQDKDQAKTVREINSIAQKSGIQLDSISFPASTLGSGPSAQAGDSSSSSEAPPSNNLTQVTPVEGISGVYALEITLSSSSVVPYGKFLNFLERLESNRRTAHVREISLTPSEGGQNISFNLTLEAFVKP